MGKRKRKDIRLPSEIIGINKRMCIACTACAITCTKVTNISVLKLSQPDEKVVKPKKNTFNESGCINCGQCTLMCPTSAINSRKDIGMVEEAKSNNKFMVAMFAPAIKGTLGEEFNNKIGTDVSKKLSTSARLLGFSKVFETDFGADLTIMEESFELYNKIKNNEKLPMFTSCCPAWITWAEKFKRELLPMISKTKSPQQMMGAIIKTYFAQKNNLKPEDIFLCSIKPCTAKKFEAEREGMGRNGYKDVDCVLTVREYGELLKMKGINLNDIPEEESDNLLGEYSGAGVIFGGSGGVLRAALRTLAYYFGEKNLDPAINIDLVKSIRFPGVLEVSYTVNNMVFLGAAVSGISNLVNFLNSDEWKKYHFIEVMACPGGCINGGGTPKILKKGKIKEEFCISCGTCIENCPVRAIEWNNNGFAEVISPKCVGCTLCSNLCRSNAAFMELYDKSTGKVLAEDYKDLRRGVLNNIDKGSKIRLSHENSEILELYKTFLGEVFGEKSKSLLYIEYK
ncbi:MAG: [FeFe] hydrogenase, group A [Clostridium sp.]